LRPRLVAVAVAAIYWAVCLVSPSGIGVHLLTNTVFAMGGTGNPAGVGMDKELDGYVSGAAGTPFAGYRFQALQWSATIAYYGIGGLPYDISQAEGVSILDSAIKSVEAGSKVVAVGYSSSAGVITKELRTLQARRAQGLSAPSPTDLSFVVMGNPNRPNGGMLTRVPGLYVPFPIGATFDGPTPVTDYQLLDVSWEYDPISDLPAHPFNLLADLNAVVAYFTRHSYYYDADLLDPAVILSDVTAGGTRYLTLTRTYLPILEPLAGIGVLKPLMDAVQPVLRYVIDLAYDRTVSPGAFTPLRLTPVPRDPVQVIEGFFEALGGADVAVPTPLADPSVESTVSRLPRTTRLSRLAGPAGPGTWPGASPAKPRLDEGKPADSGTANDFGMARAVGTADRAMGHRRGQPAHRAESQRTESASAA
jgi:hypothetical protein